MGTGRWTMGAWPVREEKIKLSEGSRIDPIGDGKETLIQY